MVVELSEPRSSSVAAGTLQFMKQVPGCQVIRILTEPSYWAERNPKFEKMMCEGKVTRQCDIEAVREQLVRIAEGGASIIFATNERVTLLREHGLDYDSLKTVIPDIVVVLVTPFEDVAEREEVRGELGGFTIASSIGEFFSGVRAAPAKLPSQMGELCVSMSVLGALASAHFHRLRTGEGQRVHLSLQGAGVWFAGCAMAVCYNESLWSLFRNLNTTDKRPLVGWDWMNLQIPIYSNFKTKDGAAVTLTPVTPPNLMKHAKAMGFILSMACSIASAMAKAKLTGGKKHPLPTSCITTYEYPCITTYEYPYITFFCCLTVCIIIEADTFGTVSQALAKSNIRRFVGTSGTKPHAFFAFLPHHCIAIAMCDMPLGTGGSSLRTKPSRSFERLRKRVTCGGRPC